MSEDKQATKKQNISSDGGYYASVMGAGANMTVSVGEKADRDSLAAKRKACQT